MTPLQKLCLEVHAPEVEARKQMAAGNLLFESGEAVEAFCRKLGLSETEAREAAYRWMEKRAERGEGFGG